MFGWVTRSLSYETHKAIKNWKKSSQYRLEFEYSFFEKMFTNLAQKPLKYILILLVFYSTLGLIPAIWQNEFICAFVSNSEYPEETMAYFSNLWSIQATIVGLVYPIVIGFIGLLLQNRSADRVMLSTYLVDSSAIFAGLSSLFLVAFMGLQYLVRPFFSNVEVAGFLFANNLWFVFNVSCTAWFLYRTIAFIKPDLRQRNLKKYIVNIAYPLEIEKLLKVHLFTNAISLNLIGGTNWENESDDEKPRIAMHSIFGEFGDVELAFKFRSKKVLHNVLFRPLRAYPKTWYLVVI